MPAKFKPSEVVINRVRGQRMSTYTPIKKYKHYYMKQMPKAELFEYINKYNAKPKIRQKCLNELVRRGIEIVWVDQV
jgi:hypothetical protein